ncbi:hypothetical protein DFP72DRAFT_201505 [Ephemerocybe angulata]|uniref:Uncharacterized protein n=1 Tax=Ephemerocybe angulata TaxID=980116 RepID=A0A8H6II21_9AGAR|nr:hypothetical protein DFP72DRAFT_201505 [Tulosesus angulatus]
MASGNHKLPLTFDVFAIPRDRRSPDTIAVGTRYTLQKYQPTQHTPGAVHSTQLHARKLTLALEHSYEVPFRYIMMPFGHRPCLYPGLSTLKGFLTSSGTADWELNNLPGSPPNGFPISLIYWISPHTERGVSDYTGGMRFVLLGPGPLLSWCPASSRCLFYYENTSLPMPPETAFEVFDYMS